MKELVQLLEGFVAIQINICMTAICAPRPKQIRVCTGAELKRMCPPKICHCEKPKGGGLLALLGFGIKVAMAAAAVYVSYDMGIWGSTDDTQELYKSYCSLMGGPSKEKITKWEPPSCEAEKDLFKVPRFNPYAYCDKPPFDSERQTYQMQENWNHAVEYVFSGIVGFPYNIISKFVKEEVPEDPKKKCKLYSELSEEERQILNSYKK